MIFRILWRQCSYGQLIILHVDFSESSDSKHPERLRKGIQIGLIVAVSGAIMVGTFNIFMNSLRRDIVDDLKKYLDPKIASNTGKISTIGILLQKADIDVPVDFFAVDFQNQNVIIDPAFNLGSLSVLQGPGNAISQSAFLNLVPDSNENATLIEAQMTTGIKGAIAQAFRNNSMFVLSVDSVLAFPNITDGLGNSPIIVSYRDDDGNHLVSLLMMKDFYLRYKE